MKQKFLEHLNNGDRSFILPHEYSSSGMYATVLYQDNLLIYMTRIYEEESSFETLKKRLNLVGIRDRNGKVYMLDMPFGDYQFKDWDDNFLYFDDAYNEAKRIANECYIKKRKEMVVDLPDEVNEGIKSLAWYLRLKEESGEGCERVLHSDIISKYDFFDMILKNESVEQYVDSYIKKHMDDVLVSEAKYRKAMEYRSSYDDCLEFKIFCALNDVKAVTVNVTFEKNGKTATGKIAKDTVLNTVRSSYSYYSMDFDMDFDTYNFCNRKEGDRVIKYLRDPNFNWYGRENRLYLKDIVKITYGKRVLYEREF